MKRFISKLFGTTNLKPAASRRVRAFQPQMELLDARLVPATLGLKTAVLDFGPATGNTTITGAQKNLGGWIGSGAETVNGFRSLFVNTTTQRFLDVTGNGIVNQVDATQVIDQIVAKVRADYAPYHIQIISSSFAAQSGRLTDFMFGDVFMQVTGGVNTVDTNFGAGIFGVAPVDLGNLMDNIGFAFGQNILGFATSAQDLINMTARTISHEMGHSFGLAHITDTAGDAVSHHLMNAPNNGVDPRDFSRDFVFMDQNFNTDIGVQNAHQILSNAFVLGESSNSWMAMLRAGQLTVSGRSLADAITVAANGADTSLTITVNGLATTVTRSSLSLSSFNPFDAAITRVNVNGLGGSDTITMNLAATVRAFVDGGAGNDVITGGLGDDVLRGGDGNDQLFGSFGADLIEGQGGNDILDGSNGGDVLRGGDGNDVLRGDGGADVLEGQGGEDILRGGTGNDSLFGGDGLDDLFGEAGNDRLDGGGEFPSLFADRLTGGTGTDIFVQHRGFFGFFDQDDLLDRTGGETVLNV